MTIAAYAQQHICRKDYYLYCDIQIKNSKVHPESEMTEPSGLLRVKGWDVFSRISYITLNVQKVEPYWQTQRTK